MPPDHRRDDDATDSIPAQWIEQHVVATGHDEVGDLDRFTERLAGLLDVVGGRVDAPRLEVLGGRDGVAADDGGRVGVGHKEPGEAGRDPVEREEVDARCELIRCGDAALEDRNLGADHRDQIVVAVRVGLMHPLDKPDTDRLTLRFGNQPLGAFKRLKAAAMERVQAGQKDVGDVAGTQGTALRETRLDDLRRKRRVDEDDRIAGTHQRRRRVAGADVALLVPERVGRKGADRDHADFGGTGFP